MKNEQSQNKRNTKTMNTHEMPHSEISHHQTFFPTRLHRDLSDTAHQDLPEKTRPCNFCFLLLVEKKGPGNMGDIRVHEHRTNDPLRREPHGRLCIDTGSQHASTNQSVPMLTRFPFPGKRGRCISRGQLSKKKRHITCLFRCSSYKA